MARRTPGRVQMICSTTGNGPYTLADPPVALAGKRTVAQAITDGSLVNGDEILYAIVDPLAAGNAKMMEVGRGTLNTSVPSAPVLTPVQVYEKSALLTSGGGWGAGTRDVLISPPGAWNTAFLDFANFFSALQTFQAGCRAEYGSGKFVEMSSVSSQGAIANYRPENNKVPFYIGNLHTGGGSPSGETAIQFLVGAQSSIVLGPKIRETGALETNSGLKYVALAGGNVNKLPWYQAAAPTGWVKDTSQNDKAMRVVSGGTGGTSGGTRALSALTVGGRALTANQMNAHNHTVAYSTVNVEGLMPSSPTSVIATLGSGGSSANTNSVGADQTHDHDLALAYIDLIICSLT